MKPILAIAVSNSIVALLRGINVGGKNRVPMGELRSELASLGLEDVVTYLQSGNVVFRRPRGGADEIAAGIEERIADVFGVNIKVLTRTPSELREITRYNPFLEDESDLARLHVVFLDRRPTKAAAAKLDPSRSPTDEFKLHGREVYLHVPNGYGRSRLTIDYFERRLDVAASARNWKTVTKLRALSER